MIVLDSSFLVAFYNERDAHHAVARAAMERFLDGRWGKGTFDKELRRETGIEALPK